jgi:hypothetical protein
MGDAVQALGGTLDIGEGEIAWRGGAVAGRDVAGDHRCAGIRHISHHDVRVENDDGGPAG